MQHDSKPSDSPGSEPQGQPAPQPGFAQAGPAGDLNVDIGPDQMREIINALQAENDKLRADLDGEKDQALRVRAEMENMRKRGDREKAEVAKYAITKFAGDIVNVADNFDRALKAVPTAAAAENATLKALHEGVSMTEREFLNVLERHGVRRIDPTGQPFNPHQHQAVMEQQNAEVAAGTVLQVFQQGYIIEDRVLRPAMVVVARGGAKPAKPADTAGAPQAPGAANDDAPPGGQKPENSAGPA